MTATTHVLVDLDNIMFLKGETRVDILKLRLKAISEFASGLGTRLRKKTLKSNSTQHPSKIHWFCNVDTDATLKKARIVLKGEKYVYASEVDRADHALVQHLSTMQSMQSMQSVATIVTADMSLMRLAMYTTQRQTATVAGAAGAAGAAENKAKLLTSKRAHTQFASFGEGVSLRAVAPQLLVFDSSADLRKFVATVILYDSRYPAIPKASRARVTPIVAASGSVRSLTSTQTR